MREKVSIVIPTYQGSKTVYLACYSALKQTYKNIEVIVVDDNGVGSDEQRKTESVLEPLIRKGAIKYVCHEVNRNGSAARNTGLRISSGKYINFIDDDDVIFPSKVEKQLQRISGTADSIAMCVCNGFYVRTDGVGYEKKIRRTNKFLYNYMKDHYYFNTTAILFKTNILFDMGGFDESFIRHQDWELCCRMLSVFDAVTVNETLMVRYLENRNNPANLQTRHEQLEYFFDKNIPYLNKRLNKKEVKNIIRYKHREIYQMYIMEKNFYLALMYGKKYSGNSIQELVASIIGMAYIFLRKYLFGNRKVIFSREELEKILLEENEFDFRF